MFDIKKIAFLALIASLSSCDRPEIEEEPQVYTLPVPAHFPRPIFDTENPMTRGGVELGRMLFYDVRLSANNKVSCASCHDPKLAFSDGVNFSTAGVAGTSLLRHSPALFNLAWANNGLFWDGGSTNLESQVFGPLTAHDEMAKNLYELVDELNAVPAYLKGFEEAFNDEISSPNIAKALAQFQRTLISANSRYDRYRLNKADGALTLDELKGLELVKKNWQACHSGELFTDQDYHNNGLDADFSDTSHEGLYQGRSRITYDPLDTGKFRTPSLRNVAITAPYMHDGRFANLDDVLDHYSDQVKGSSTLDSRLVAGGMKLSAVEKQHIIAFLGTLTDYGFIRNKDHQKP